MHCLILTSFHVTSWLSDLALLRLDNMSCWPLQVVFVLPTAYPVTSLTLNYSPVAVGIVLVGSLLVWFLPVVGARKWYHGAAAAKGGLAKLRVLKDYEDSVRAGTVNPSV